MSSIEGVSAAGAVAAALAQREEYAKQDVQVAVLKKALDAQAEGAVTLLDSVAPMPSLPPHLGQNVNTTA